MKTKRNSSIIQKCLTFFVIFGLLFTFQLVKPSRAIEGTKPADAEWLVDSGENHIWYQIAEDTLIIGGFGEMPDWNSGEDTPWYDSKSSITKVVVNEGITRIGNNSFRGDEDNKYISSIEEIILPKTITSIGDYVFQKNGSLSIIAIKNPTPPVIGNEVLNDTNEGMAFVIPASAREAYLNSEYWKFDEDTSQGYLIDIDGWSNALSAYFVYIVNSNGGGSISSTLEYQYEDFECGEYGCEYVFADLYPLLINPPLVTLTTTPDDGYFVKSLTVTTEDGTNIPVENNSFTMPAGSVTINAIFSNTEADPEIPKCPDTGIIH